MWIYNSRAETPIMETQQHKIFDCLKEPEVLAKIEVQYLNSMKKSFMILAVTLMSLSSLSSYAKRWLYKCPGGGSTIFTTSDDTTAAQASAMGQAWCDAR